MKHNADSEGVPSPRLQRGTPIGSSSDAIRAAVQVRQMQKQRTRENFLFGTAAGGGAEDVEDAGDETPKAETAAPDNDAAAVTPGIATPSEAPRIHARQSEEGATRATCPAPITASASSSSLLSRIVRPRIRIPTISSATK